MRVEGAWARLACGRSGRGAGAAGQVRGEGGRRGGERAGCRGKLAKNDDLTTKFRPTEPVYAQGACKAPGRAEQTARMLPGSVLF